jgi:hypothetical protein
MRDVASDRDEAAFRHWQPPPSRSRLPILPRIGDWLVMGGKPAFDLTAMMKSQFGDVGGEASIRSM